MHQLLQALLVLVVERGPVYDVKLAVRLSGAYGGSKYRKSPGAASSRHGLERSADEPQPRAGERLRDARRACRGSTIFGRA